MSPFYKRLTTIAGLFFAASGFALFIGIALKNNIRFFVTPSQIFSENLTHHKVLKLGGVVKTGTVQHNGLNHQFTITDGKTDIIVQYHGILPDLFRDDQTVVVEGTLNQENLSIFTAKTVLAKHDENYRPPVKELMNPPQKQTTSS